MKVIIAVLTILLYGCVERIEYSSIQPYDLIERDFKDQPSRITVKPILELVMIGHGMQVNDSTLHYAIATLHQTCITKKYSEVQLLEDMKLKMDTSKSFYQTLGRSVEYLDSIKIQEEILTIINQ